MARRPGYRCEGNRGMANLVLSARFLTIHYKDVILVTDRDGWIHQGRTGLFGGDTRYLSIYRLTINGFDPLFLGVDRTCYFAATFSYTNPAIGVGPRAVAANSLFLKVSRFVREGVHEDIDLTNYSGRPINLSLVLDVSADFADIFQVRGIAPVIPRLALSRWENAFTRLVFHYRKKSFSRTFHLRFAGWTSPPSHGVGKIIFDVALGPGETWHTCVEGRFEEGVGLNHADAHAVEPLEEELSRWQSEATRVEAPATAAGREFERTYEQAVLDLAALRLERVGDEWFPSAGVPWYVAVFGRDALIAAFQSLTAHLPIGLATLTQLAQLQGRAANLWTDEQPGRIPHELRHDELTVLGKLFYSPYYGTVDASLLYVILLHALYCWTGDRSLVERFYDPAAASLDWAIRDGDRDGDGFVEYRPGLPTGYRNQSWKDAEDAVVYPDGSLVADPIAIVEVQGYFYDALRRMALLARLLGKGAEADSYECRATDLFRRFNEIFWMEDEGTYAFGLDPRKQSIRSVASNPGHLLWSRIVPSERARCVANRLLAADMFSGWGIRTLSARHPAYDPVSYQRGSVWPHDNAIIALGLKRYGFWQEANQIAEAIFSAAACYERHALPEVFAGLDRGSGNLPVPYAEANAPQAWAAGSVFMLLRAILGLEADPVRRRLIVAPTLPSWLPALTLRNLTIFGQSLDVRFQGIGAESTVEVIRNEGGVGIDTRRGDRPSDPLQAMD